MQQLSMHSPNPVLPTTIGTPTTGILGQLYEAVQVVGMQVFILILQPVLYQSVLVISHSLCYPFGDCLLHLPTEMFIQHTRYELQVMEIACCISQPRCSSS